MTASGSRKRLGRLLEAGLSGLQGNREVDTERKAAVVAQLETDLAELVDRHVAGTQGGGQMAPQRQVGADHRGADHRHDAPSTDVEVRPRPEVAEHMVMGQGLSPLDPRGRAHHPLEHDIGTLVSVGREVHRCVVGHDGGLPESLVVPSTVASSASASKARGGSPTGNITPISVTPRCS